MITLLLFGAAVYPPLSVRAEEYYDDESYDDDQEETEFIPEAYYDPIQSNLVEGWPQGPAVQAGGAIVMDMDTGTVLYAKNVDQTFFPASITKIMTALVAIENGDLNKVISCSELVYDIEEGSSHLGIAPGEEVTLEQALYGLMLESANDLGMAIAVEIGGSIDGFAGMMNEKAAQLGCTNTHFVNPHGLHNENHYTTAADMAKIATAAYQNPVFRRICSTVEYTIPPTNTTEETRYLLNHHRMLQHSSEFYRSYCTGGKTGYTSDAWNTLVTFGEMNDLRLVCVLLRGNGAYRNYDETAALMEYGFVNFVHTSLLGEIPRPTFYQLLGLNYPVGNTAIEMNEKLMQPVLQVVSDAVVTIPSYARREELQSSAQGEDGRVEYSYHGWYLGEAQIAVTPIPTDISFKYEAYRDMEEVLKTAQERKQEREILETGEKAAASIANFFTGTAQTARTYVEENPLTAALIGGFLLLILLILLVILILRCTRESRIARRRAQEERQRQKNAEEIERKSAVEIEQELRAAMEAEDRRRKAEEARRMEQQRMENELAENEKIVEQYIHSSSDRKDRPHRDRRRRS